jgi:hypothetical protein
MKEGRILAHLLCLDRWLDPLFPQLDKFLIYNLSCQNKKLLVVDYTEIRWKVAKKQKQYSISRLEPIGFFKLISP